MRFKESLSMKSWDVKKWRENSVSFCLKYFYTEKLLIIEEIDNTTGGGGSGDDDDDDDDYDEDYEEDCDNDCDDDCRVHWEGVEEGQVEDSRLWLQPQSSCTKRNDRPRGMTFVHETVAWYIIY